MVSNLITAQVIRYVTDRVMENLSRQAGRVIPSGDVGTSSVVQLAQSAQINQQFERLGGRLDDLDNKVAELSSRLSAAEKKSGWRYTVRLTFGVVMGIFVGVAATVGAHLAGWIG